MPNSPTNHNLESSLCHPERSVNVAEGSHLSDSSTSPTATLRMTKLVVTSHSPINHNFTLYAFKSKDKLIKRLTFIDMFGRIYKVWQKNIFFVGFSKKL